VLARETLLREEGKEGAVNNEGRKKGRTGRTLGIRSFAGIVFGSE